MILAVEAAKERVTVGEDAVSGLMFAGAFEGISATSEGLQKHTEKTLDSTRVIIESDREREKMRSSCMLCRR